MIRIVGIGEVTQPRNLFCFGDWLCFKNPYGHEFEQAPGVGDGQIWHGAVYGFRKSQTQLRD